jgi:hypothetical protein
MAMNNWERDIARRFDGETTVDESAPVDMQAAAHESGLRLLREGVRQATQRAEIADAQFPAFMEGIRESIERPQRGYHRFWAVISLSTAALLVAFSAFLVFTTGDQTVPLVVEAVTNEVETVSTEINGATVDSYTDGDGTTVLWVSAGKRDLL